MRNKWIKRFFPLIAAFLLAPWPIAYAYDYNSDITSQDTVQIEVAGASVRPTWTVFEKTTGGVSTPGALFYIDATNNAADIQANLYITNAQELIHYYRYLILKVGIYVEISDGEWMEAANGDGERIDDIFITLRDGRVSFTLPGYTKHKVTIDSGSFHCINANADEGSLSPQFYLTVD